MALNIGKTDDKMTEFSWTSKYKKSTRIQLPPASHSTSHPVIDYDKLRQLCTIDGLKDIDTVKSTAEAHRAFMSTYKTMFVQDEQKSGIPNHSVIRSREKSRRSGADDMASDKSLVSYVVAQRDPNLKGSQVDSEDSHNISNYLAELHNTKTTSLKEQPKDRTKLLRKLLRKLPFERTAGENDQIYSIVHRFAELCCQVEPLVLKELCVVAQLEVWKEDNITLFGNTGLHIVLKGSVRPHNKPHIKFVGQQINFRSPTPEPRDPLPQLQVGDCFGTLEQVSGRSLNSRILTVLTTDTHCEFMKISTTDYARIIEQMKQREETAKVDLLQSCESFKLWSKQPLAKVASLITLNTFPPNTILVSESFTAPYIGIIKSGECRVLRQVEVMRPLPNGTMEKVDKQVVMGKLEATHSFGEVSIILDEPVTCSIVTATNVDVAVIEPHKLKELDEVTLQLLLQSSERTFGKITQEDIHNEYINQEMKREWNEFKHNVVVDVINSRGIRPGYGKWAK
ncbi:Cyclic nucleotide-binding domain-containing protein 1 [Lamellibrachia satsuma]|nr:Cyclic nucleotide-binding domain-containing protein 1 [Lamellibrachia satsuma]